MMHRKGEKTMRKFELNETTKRFTEPKDLKRLRIVIQTTNKVIANICGLEPMLFMYVWNNMKKNQFALVFDQETGKMYGYISKDEDGIPHKYIEPEELTFSDMYEMAD